MKKAGLIISGLAFLAGLLWLNRFALAKFYYMRAYFKESPKKMIELSEKEFLEDREFLSRYGLFSPSLGTKDAGPYLNPMLHWQLGEVHHQGSLKLPTFVHKEMNKDWVLKKPLFKKMGLKFDWMKELQDYDVWSPEKGSPAYPAGKKFNPYTLPMPTYSDLIIWAKLRYLYGKETGNAEEALKEVRHLMRLIWTNDTLVSSMVVIRMLQNENQFEEILTPKEMGKWQFIPHDHLMRAKRHFYSLPTVVDIRLPDPLFEKMTKTSVGRCHMLSEGMMDYLAYRDLLKDELQYGYKRMEDEIKNSNCRRSLLHEMWEDPTWPTMLTMEGVEVLNKDVGHEELRKNKDLKAVVGYIMKNMAVATHWQYVQ